MDIIVIKPTDDELAALLAEHLHRLPEKAKIHVIGDGGLEVAVPVLLGMPSGACKMANPDLVAPAWDAVAAARFGGRGDESDLADQLADDCVLWPDAATWGAYKKRWPALPELVQVAVRRKTGAARDMLSEPGPKTEKSTALTKVLERHPSAAWRRFTAGAEVVDLAIAPPDYGVWRMFKAAMKERDARHAQLVRDVVVSAVRAALYPDGTPVEVEPLLTRWCGLALSLGVTVSHLAGLTGSVELGEW